MLEGEPPHGPERPVRAKLTLKTTRVYISKVELHSIPMKLKNFSKVEQEKKRIISSAVTLPASMLNVNIVQTSR